MRNKILAFILIGLMVQFLMPALALAEDLPAVDQPATTDITLQSEPVVTEPVAIEPVVSENDTTEAPIDLTQPEPTVEVSGPAPLVETVAPAYKLPTNPLCAGITGDLNGDGLINKYDTEVMIQMAKGLEPFSPCADLDLDGFVGPRDLSILTKMYKFDLPAHPEIVAELAEIKAEADVEREADSNSNSCTLGDANGDNMIDYKDSGLILQMMKGELARTKSADLDGDGYIGPADLSIITSMIKFSHAESAAVTAQEKGNCDLPTASVMYSLDGGATYTPTITVKNGDTLTIKAIFTKPLNRLEYAYLDIDNGLGADLFMSKANDSESVYNLVINNSGNVTAAVSIKTVNGAFDADSIILTSGLNFSIENAQASESSAGNAVGASYPACETVNYGDWSIPADGKSTREVVSKIPFDCVLTSAQLQEMVQTATLVNLVVTAPITGQVLGEKIYSDGTLLRAVNDFKIYVLENGSKRHIKTLKELATKYFGQAIINVSDEVLALYPTIK